MSSLNGKVIVVTGGASGIGLATVQRLLSLGAFVAVADLPKTTPETLESLQPSSEHFFYRSADVASRASCASFIDHVIQKFGRVDGLVNNAGVIPYEGEMASDELYDTVVGVNVNGVWFMGTEVIKRISQAGRAGAIVTTASDAALRGIQGSPVYCMTKHAVLGLTRAWSKDWCGRGIRVNAIAPGVTETPAISKVRAAPGGYEMISGWLKDYPMGRFADPSEQAATICFLLSDDASFISGQVIRVSGGAGEG
ncbi:hypothetical protein LTR67_003956 [Exophiala xenobiotica]